MTIPASPVSLTSLFSRTFRREPFSITMPASESSAGSRMIPLIELLRISFRCESKTWIDMPLEKKSLSSMRAPSVPLISWTPVSPFESKRLPWTHGPCTAVVGVEELDAAQRVADEGHPGHFACRPSSGPAGRRSRSW